MTSEQTALIVECAASSISGQTSFGEIVMRLQRAGIERYHADYTRMETTYYLPDGDSCVVPIDHPHLPIAEHFRAEQIESSVRQSQRGEIKYPQFLRQSAAAGCVGYFVLITGQRVQYLGREGDIHTEWFPGASKR